MSTDLLQGLTYKVEEIPVSELQVDHRVQRSGLNMTRVNAMVKSFNQGALGVATISRRADRGNYILDGWHRTEAIRRLTDNAGLVTCHVYEDLTIEQEAALFLALNTKVTPNVMDRFQVSVNGNIAKAVEIDQLVRAYGWNVSGVPGNGNINAVRTLERVYDLSLKIEAEPNLLQVVLIIITRAWGQDRHGAQAVILEGLAALIAEHGSRVNLDRLVNVLKAYKGGPQQLHGESTDLARLRKLRVPMAVADIITESYNRGSHRQKLPVWRRRS